MRLSIDCFDYVIVLFLDGCYSYCIPEVGQLFLELQIFTLDAGDAYVVTYSSFLNVSIHGLFATFIVLLKIE